MIRLYAAAPSAVAALGDGRVRGASAGADFEEIASVPGVEAMAIS